ncbi:MAG TPA: xanthine dehydrogenase family protein molybdopterin-binding subunit [Acidimicrobiia bacterium]|jgi:carbon-monoxide dehydrogenase large subunit
MTTNPPTNDFEFRGQAVHRREDARHVVGRGRFIGDMEPEGLLHARFVRSDAAHGLLRGLDLEDARSAPGVVAVFGGDDLDVNSLPVEAPSLPQMIRPLLATERIRFVGEALAVVIAETERQAFDAADLVWPDIEELDAVTTPEEALSDRVVLHPEVGTNLVQRTPGGDPDDDPWDYEVDVTVRVHNQRLAPSPIEPLTALAEPKDGGVRLWVGHQAPHQLKGQLERLLGFEVDVIVPDVGGGFGQKGRFFPEYAVVAQAASRLGRPVRWLQTRRESLAAATHGRDMTSTIRLAGDNDGRIRRGSIEIVAAVGAYPHTGAQVPLFTRLVSQDMYDLEQLHVEVVSVVTNAAPTAPYRGAGRPEAAYAMERAVDAFARAVGMDPVDVRRKNLLAGPFPIRSRTGAIYDSGDYRAALDLAVELIDLPRWRKEQQRRLAEGEDPIGVGIGAYVERAGGPPDSGEYARVELDEDGKVVVRTGSTSNGQGHDTVWSQVASQIFDVPIEDVTVIAGDTSRVARGWGSMASRSAQIGASGVWLTGRRLRDRARRLAADMLEAAEDDLVLEKGAFKVRGVPDEGVSLAAIVAEATRRGEQMAEEEFYSPGAQTFPYGVHAAVVSVSLETGEVELLDIVAVDDCGNVLNPMIVEGQTHGSLAQGIGQALLEEVRYDENGQLQTATFVDYLLPHATDLPLFRTGRVVSPAPSNPLGAKGAGESGCIGGPPAVVNAVLDALHPFGVTHLDMPLRPAKVWEALQGRG